MIIFQIVLDINHRDNTKMVPDETKEAMSQEEINAYITRMKANEEKQRQPILEKREDMLTTADSTGEVSQNDTDVFKRRDVWENMDHEILSQDEIDALLSGFNGEGSTPVGESDFVTAPQKRDHPGPMDDLTIISKQKHIERQRKREENIILKKREASVLIRKLLQAEEERIMHTLAWKDKMINKDLYARYEITRSDRTKMIVSMSKKAAEEYRSIHPEYCIYKI